MSRAAEDGPLHDPVPAAPPPSAAVAAVAAAIYDPAHVPATSAAYRETPVPDRLSVPDYTGTKFHRLRRKIVAIGLVLAVPLVLFADRPFAGHAAAVFRIDLAAWIVLAAGLCLRAYATLHLAAAAGERRARDLSDGGEPPNAGAGSSGTAAGAGAARLIETGPYAMLRHPGCAGGFLAGLGGALLSGAPACLAAYVLAAGGLSVAEILFEERRLIVAFPGPAQAWRARVPMLLPRRLRLELPAARPALRPMLREMVLAIAFVLAALAVQGLVVFAAHRHWPAIFRLG
ncbi:MAG: hypothetical protein ACREJ2_06945 [Planctomycetota bacterium]